MARGRLIFPFLVELAPLDTLATETTDPDGAGPLVSGYDETFRVPVKVAAGTSDQSGTTARVEGALVQVPAQIEPDQFEALAMMLSGESPSTNSFRVVMHYADLEVADLVEADGTPKVRKRDRLTRILNMDGDLVETIPDSPGLFVVRVMSRGWGLGGRAPTRNLLFVDFEERAVSVTGG
jgi:hypothetical protein